MRLDSFKHKRCDVTRENEIVTIGKEYCSGSMKRNGNSLNLLRPQKFGLDRTNWCKYGAFYDIYDSIEKALIEAKVMTMLEEPEWQDKDGNRVKFESEAYGCRVTSKITRPDMVLLGDEFGGNIDMIGDGHIVGEKLICDKDCIAQRKETRKMKHFTVIWLTNLLGELFFAL